MNKLINSLKQTQNRQAFTQNGALSNRSTLNACLDFFGKVGAMRNMSEDEIVRYFSNAFSEDPQTALRILFYGRDVRGGQGERDMFRTVLNHLGDTQWKWLSDNIHLIMEYGRADDFYALEKTRAFPVALDFIKNRFESDLGNNKPSLLGKWLKSENTSSKESRRLASITRKHLGLNSREYRKALASLRKRIGIVERNMCSGEWDGINYESVPSRAAMIYRKAFQKHDETGYREYLDAVESGEKGIKTATLYPYDIFRKVLYNYEWDRTLEAQWNNLPNYVEPFNGLVIADTSASMTWEQNGLALAVALSLALYIAERNEEPWKDYFMAFTSRSELVRVQGDDLRSKAANMRRAPVGGSTNLQSAFKVILDTALRNKLSQADMPEILFIVSDFQFDRACSNNSKTNLEAIRGEYATAGYEMPRIVFWNVNARGDDQPITINDDGAFLVSGCSPSIFKSTLSQSVISPVDMMNEVVNSARYTSIKY